MTLATLVVTHHSSMPARAPDPLAAVETADRASTAWALRDDEADEEEMQRELEKLDGDLARVKKDAAEVTGMGLDDDAYEPRAPKRRAERVAHRSPFESESEEAPADVDDDRARKTAKRAHHRTASASGSESSLDLDLSDEALEDFAFDAADAMDLEEYAGLARARRVKLERFEDVLADEAQMREMLRRAIAKVARGEAVRPVAPGDISRALGFEISSSLAEKRREHVLAEARQSLSAADASVGKAEDSEVEDSESPKDEGFEDATWAEDDYRAAATSTKDPNAMNRLDPVVSAPGAPSEKTDDETMAKLLKHVEENKATIAEQVIRDDGELDEDAFIQELVREGAIVAPEDEPERARKTSAGNYLDGAFDGDDLRRIVNDEDVRTLDERVNQFPELAEADVEDNARDEIPEAFVNQDVSAMEDAFENLKETLASRYEETDLEAPAPEEMEAEGPAEAEEADAPEAAPAPEEMEAEGPAEAEEEAPEPAAADEAEGPAEAEEAEEAASAPSEAEEAAGPAEAEDAEEEDAAAPGPAEPLL